MIWKFRPSSVARQIKGAAGRQHGMNHMA